MLSVGELKSPEVGHLGRLPLSGSYLGRRRNIIPVFLFWDAVLGCPGICKCVVLAEVPFLMLK